MTEKEKALKLQRLLDNPDFEEFIVTGFIMDGIFKFSLEDDVDNESVRDELKARRILNDYIYGIIEESKIIELEKE